MGELDEKLNAILGDPQAMGQIMALARSLGGQGGAEAGKEAPEREPEQHSQEPPLFYPEELDPRLLQMGMRVLREYQREDERKTALLTALRPFVKEERYANLDRAIQIAKLSRLIRAALEELGRGEGRV